MVDDADVAGMSRESGEFVALPVVVVVGHCIGEATDNGLGNVYSTKKSVCHVNRLPRVPRPSSPLFFGWVDLE